MQDQLSMLSGSSNDESSVGGDRRLLRPYPNQVLKCPRCDSLNTKFCYYNNYNLSQPRHFCKNCRRYWTKGGVLRNVPVGGGCRKAKRSKPKSETPAPDNRRKQRKLNDNIHSSSESSTVTVSINEPEPSNPACSSSLPALLSSSNSGLFLNQDYSNLPNFESPSTVDQSLDGSLGFHDIGSFVGLLNAGSTYNATQISPFRLNHQQNELQQHEKMSTAEEMKTEELPAGCDNDQTVGIDLSGSNNNGGDGELTALNWEGSQGLFDLTQEYWSQNQWTGPNQHLYLP